MDERNTTPKRYLYIEFLRIIAVFFVIFNHTGNQGFLLFTQREAGSSAFWVYLFISIFCKFSVGLFLAISGALMLGRENESLKTLWTKRILKIAGILFVFSLIYYINRKYLYGEVLSLKGFINTLYVGGAEGHLWYLYAHITFLISLPFFRALVKSLKTKYYYYMIGIFLFLNSIVPVLEYLVWKGSVTLNWHITVPWLGINTVMYPLLGYFLQNKLEIEKSKKWMPFLWILNVAGILISCYMTYYKGIYTGVFSSADSQTFHGKFAILNVIGIFVTVKYIFVHVKMPNWMEKLISSMGACSFGIYLIHVLVLKSSFMKEFLDFLLETGMNDMAAVLIQCFAVLLICYAIVFIWKKITAPT